MLSDAYYIRIKQKILLISKIIFLINYYKFFKMKKIIIFLKIAIFKKKFYLFIYCINLNIILHPEQVKHDEWQGLHWEFEIYNY